MNSVEREGLRGRWHALWKRLDVSADRVPSIEPLLSAYEDPSRGYHNLGHIVQCLGELDRERDSCDEPDTVELAIWYHDVVYDPTRSDNEERSADLAADDVRAAELPHHVIQTVIELIHATKHTYPPVTPDAQILVDIDLSILGQEPEVFDGYERAIRKEYAHVDDGAFREGRSKILRRFLERPALYGTAEMRDRYEAQARQNLARSIARLSNS